MSIAPIYALQIIARRKRESERLTAQYKELMGVYSELRSDYAAGKSLDKEPKRPEEPGDGLERYAYSYYYDCVKDYEYTKEYLQQCQRDRNERR